MLNTQQAHGRIIVPELAAGEAYTKLRCDRRVSPRRDARVALTVFGLVEDNPDVFSFRPMAEGAFARARALLSQYVDQSFSYVDAVIFVTVDDDDTIQKLLTVDGRDFSIYRFAHPVEVVTP